MSSLDDIEEMLKGLDPQTVAIVNAMKVLMKSMQASFQAQIEQLQATITQKDQENAQLKQMLFGQRSERLPRVESPVRRRLTEEEATRLMAGSPPPERPKQPPEPPSDADEAAAAQEKAEQERQRRKAGRKRSEEKRKANRKRRKELPVVHERVSVTPEQLPDGYTLEDFRALGDGDVIRRVDHVQEHLVTVEYTLEKLASKDGQHIVTAEGPPQVVDKGLYGPGVYAQVVVKKCADSLPLERIHNQFDRAGLVMPASTLCTLFHRAAELLEPIYAALLKVVAEETYVSMDETPHRIMDKDSCRRGYVWVAVTPSVIAYIFDESRSGEVAFSLIGDTEGFLTADGYSGYNAVAKSGRVRTGCWAHTRRGFFLALSTAPHKAQRAIDLIGDLFAIERLAEDRGITGTAQHTEMRQALSKPAVDRFYEWVAQHEGTVVPGSPLGKAIAFAVNQRACLERFIEDCNIPLDNNASERALRIIAVGRKNYLWVGHTEAGHNLAVLQTLVATCTLNGVNPYQYLKDVLIRIADTPKRLIHQLFPSNWTPPPRPPDQQIAPATSS